VLDGGEAPRTVVDVDDARGLDAGHAAPADRRHPARLDDGGQVLGAVQRQQEHPVDVLVGEVVGHPTAFALAARHREDELVGRLRDPLADPPHGRREVGLPEDAVAALGDDEGDDVGAPGDE
jgi:hypothetical protein